MPTKFLPLTILFLITPSLQAQTNGVAAQTPVPAASSIDAQIKEKVAALDSKVGSLPTSSPAEQYKITVLQVAMERVHASLAASLPDEAVVLMADVEKTLGVPAESLSTPSAQTNTISALMPPRVVQNNPYIDRMVAGAREELARPVKPFAKNTTAFNTFNGLVGESGSRSSGEEMQSWLWLFVNPASPLKGDPKVLERYLRLANAYIDAMDVHGSDPSLQATVAKIIDSGPKAGQGIFDDFAIAPASCALREFAQLHPGLLLPSQKIQWDRGMSNGGLVMFGKAKDRQGTYANIDIALACELLNFGLYLNNSEYLAKSKFLSEVQEKSIYPDGAIAYLGHQNESANYHNADTHYLSMIYAVNQDPKVLDLMKKSEWYGPVTCGKRGEFWTVPSWKDTWNDINSIWTGGESVAAITGNPYLRGMNDVTIAQLQGTKNWTQLWSSIPWYRNDVKPLPLPDNYTVIDRNIAGPRSWYGRFNYAASLRPIPETEPGLATIMGAQVIEPDGKIENVLMGAYPRVRMKRETITKEGKFSRQAYAWLTSGLKSAVVTGRSFSAVAGSYRLHQYGSSTKGPDVDWNGRQLWLGLPDRIIGLLEVSAAKEGAQAFDVEGVLRLGTGGTTNGKPTKIESTGKDSFKYGDLTISVLGHNYASIEAKEVPFRLPKFPNTEITFLDAKGVADPQGMTSYPATEHHWFLVEVKPSHVTTAAKVMRIEQPPGVLGYEVNLGPKQFILLSNPTECDLTYAVSKSTASGSRSLHGSFIPTPITTVPENLILKPHELAVIVTSPDQVDHLPGWSDYQEMIRRLPKTP